jgi:DNA mismatch repair protein MutL
LSHDGRETFATEGRGDRRAAVMAVYGREVAANMVEVTGTEESGPLDGVTGLTSHPETNRATREYVSTFVNGRWVTASAVRDAVVEAYGRQLASDRYPFAVVDLDVDPATVDVNVHPRKLEVRFADEAGMQRQVRDAVESGLLREGLVRTSAPRGRSKAAQTEVSPEPTEDGDGSRDEAADTPDEPADTAPATMSRREPADATDATDEPETSASAPVPDRDGPADTTDEPTGDDPDRRAAAPSTGERRFRESPAQATLDGSDPTDHEFARLPPMRVLGQLHDTYVVAETDDGLVLVDQHAADERVHFERLRERFAGDVTTQTLAEPVAVELTAAEAALVDAAREALARLGFRADRAGERTLRVTAVPALLADLAVGDLVRDLLADFAEGDPERTVARAADDLLGDLACHPAVTGNVSLTEGSVTALLAALDDCENPYACPHGRPVVVEVSRSELESRFERDYPGHGG